MAARATFRLFRSIFVWIHPLPSSARVETAPRRIRDAMSGIGMSAAGSRYKVPRFGEVSFGIRRA